MNKNELTSALNPSLVKNISEFGADNMGHGSLDVRKPAKGLLLALYKRFDFKRLEGTLKNLPARTLGLLKPHIKEIEYMG